MELTMRGYEDIRLNQEGVFEFRRHAGSDGDCPYTLDRDHVTWS